MLGHCCHSWALVHGGGAGSGLLSSPLVGWCWAIVGVCGVVLGLGPHR